MVLVCCEVGARGQELVLGAGDVAADLRYLGGGAVGALLSLASHGHGLMGVGVAHDMTAAKTHQRPVYMLVHLTLAWCI